MLTTLFFKHSLKHKIEYERVETKIILCNNTYNLLIKLSLVHWLLCFNYILFKFVFLNNNFKIMTLKLKVKLSLHLNSIKKNITIINWRASQMIFVLAENTMKKIMIIRGLKFVEYVNSEWSPPNSMSWYIYGNNPCAKVWLKNRFQS